MSAVHVGIRHDDDLVISKLRDIKIIMDPLSKRSDHRLDLRIGVDLVEAGFLYIQDLSSKRKDCLGRTVSGSLGRTAGGISSTI